jgi:hypothetical protein
MAVGFRSFLGWRLLAPVAVLVRAEAWAELRRNAEMMERNES